MVSELNNHRFPDQFWSNSEKCRATSTHASTGIEGNPLPLTDVKRFLESARTCQG